MESPHAETFKRLCYHSYRNEAAHVANIFSHQRLNSLNMDDLLLNSSVQANELHSFFFEQVLKNNNTRNEIQPEQALRALLISPSAYELPWKTARDFVAHLRQENQSGTIDESFLWTTIADIQSFLQQSVVSWLEEERKHAATGRTHRSVRPAKGETLSVQNPRYWIFELVSTVMEPLLPVSIEQQQTTDEPVALELLTTIASLCKDLDESLFGQVMGAIFAVPSIKRNHLPKWANLASELHFLLRDNDWMYVRDMIQREVSDATEPIQAIDVPDLIEPVLSIFMSIIHGEEIRVDAVQWLMIILHLLCVASRDLAIYATVENEIITRLVSLSSSMLRRWAQILSELNFKTTLEIEANMWLLLRRASRSSGSELVTKLLAQALGKDDEHLDMSQLSWNALFRILYRYQDDSSKRLEHLGDGARFQLLYSGEGKFEGDGDYAQSGSMVGSTVFRSMFLSKSTKYSRHDISHVLNRAQEWINVAEDVIDFANSRDCFISKVISVTIYSELPQLWTSLVQKFGRQLTCEDSWNLSKQSLTHYLHVLKSVVGGTGTRLVKAEESDIETLASVLKIEMPLSYYHELARAKISIPSARSEIYAFASEWLRSLSSYKFVLSNDRDFDRTKCALCGLCLLLCFGDPDEWAKKAWRQLSDLIIASCYQLPLPLKTWLYQFLKDDCLHNSFSDAVLKHIWHAVISRFLYFLADETPNSILVSKSYAVWKNPSTSIVHIRKAEDLRAILDLIVAIFFHFLSDPSIGEDSRRLAISCHHRLVMVAYNTVKPSVNGSLHSSFAFIRPTQQDSTGVLIGAASFCILKVMEFILCTKDQRYVMAGVPVVNDIRQSINNLQLEGLGAIDCSGASLIEKHVIGQSNELANENIYCEPARRFRVEMLDALSLFFFHDSWYHVDRSVFSGVYSYLPAVIELRRRLVSNSSGDDCMQDAFEDGFSLRSVFDVYNEFTFTSVENVINSNGALDTLDLDVSSVLYLSSLVVSLSGKRNLANIGPSLLRPIFRLYMVLCKEDAAVRLIHYIESQKVSDRINLFGYGPVQTPDQVDDCIQKIKLVVIQAMGSTLSEASLIDYKVDIDQRKHFLDSMISVVHQCSLDLRESLEGDSGGMTEVLLVEYANVIHLAASGLQRWITSLHERNSLATICSTVCSKLFDIVCCYDLKGSDAFKKTLTLTLSTVASLARLNDRHFLPSGSTKMTALSWSIERLTNVVEQCLAILERKNSLAHDEGVPWEEIAGSRHVDRIACYGVSVSDTCDEVLSRDCTGPYLRLASERVWTWALGCAIESVQTCWRESLQCLTFEDLDNCAATYTYTKDRTEGLIQLLSLLSRFFVGKGIVRTSINIFPVALILPSFAKSHLVSTVDAIVAIIESAVRVLDDCFHENSASDMALAEAFSCIQAWANDVGDDNLVLGVRTWLSAEKAAVVQAKRDKFVTEQSANRRLQKVVARIDSFEKALIRLYKNVNKLRDANEQACLKPSVVTLFERFVEQSSFAESLARKLERTDEDRVKLLAAMDGNDPEERLRVRNKKRSAFPEVGRRVKKEARKPMIRSRNQVVDEWLQKDTEIEEDGYDSDAYADLEDFLVDG